MEVRRPVRRPLPNEMMVLDRVVAVEIVRSSRTPNIFKGIYLKVESTGFAVVVSKREESRMAPKTETKQWKDELPLT